MKTDTFTKCILTIVTAILIVLAMQNWINQPAVVRAAVTPSKQQWEYKTITRGFHWDKGEIKGVGEWREDETLLPVPSDAEYGRVMRAKLAELGGQGWELVTVSCYSDEMNTNLGGGSSNQLFNDRASNTYLNGISENGVTTSDRWVFKRLKQ